MSQDQEVTDAIQRYIDKLGQACEQIDEFGRALKVATIRLQKFDDSLSKEVAIELAATAEDELKAIAEGLASPPAPIPQLPSSEGKMCSGCGAMMQRTGSCYTCPQCGNSDGCG